MNMEKLKLFVCLLISGAFAYSADYFWSIEGDLTVFGWYLAICSILFLLYTIVGIFDAIDELN